MLIEIDSSELIIGIIDHNNAKRGHKRIIKIDKLYKVANIIEQKHPSIVVDINKLSIEAFRCRCSEAIHISDKTIQVLTDHPKMKEVIKRYQPSGKNKDIIVRAYNYKK